MLNLKSVITQLKEDAYNEFAQSLVNSKADKFYTLLKLIREGNHGDDKIMETLKVNSSAFYTLKSRLHDKIQEYIMDKMEGPKLELLRKVAHIPTLLFNTDRELSKTALTKLEKDLLNYDMPDELTTVYSALKKLNAHSTKYYDYTQSYNKQVAYTLAIDKAEGLLIDFNKKLAEYFLSRDKSIIELLTLIKQEVTNVCRLYVSHHLYVYQCIINISYALFLPTLEGSEVTEQDEPVEDMLTKVNNIFKDYPNDLYYQYFELIFQFLAFEYYHQHKITKKAKEYFDNVNEKLHSLLLNNFTTFPSRFLISKIQQYIAINKEEQLYEENKSLKENFNPDKTDLPNYIYYQKYLAVSAFYVSRHDEAIDILNNLKNKVSFINYPHEDFEIKLLLGLFYSMISEYDLAENNLRSVERKVREFENRNYDNISTLIKMLRLPMKTKTKDLKEKLSEQAKMFVFQNQNEYQLLSYIKMDDKLLHQLATLIKR